MYQTKKMLNLLAENNVARNWNSKLLEIEYICKYICKNKQEEYIIRDILSRDRPSWATMKRGRAHIQNVLKLYEPEFEIKEARQEQEQECREYYKQNLLQRFFNFFK